MSEQPTTTIDKYEALLYMLTKTEPTMSYRLGYHDSFIDIARDLMLVNACSERVLIISDIEYRKETGATGISPDPGPALIVNDRLGERRKFCRNVLRDERDTPAKTADRRLVALVNGNDASAFTKYVEEQMRAKFSPAFCALIEQRALDRALEYLTERRHTLEHDLQNARQRVAGANEEVRNIEIMQRQTAEALKKLGAEEERAATTS